MATKVGKQSLMALWKKGWHEIPEVMGSCCLGAFGIVIGVIGLRNYYADDGDNRRYKNNYVVYRDTDPRVATIRKD